MRFRVLLVAAAVFGLVVPSTATADGQATMRPKIYKRLAKAQEALEKSKYSDAKRELDIIRNNLKPNPYELALTLQALGFVYARQEKMGQAAATLEKALALNALPGPTQTNLLYNVGQIHMAAKQYKKAARSFDKWLKVAEKPAPSSFYTVAVAKYQAKELKGCIAAAEKAVAGRKGAKDSWLQLLRTAYIETKDFRSALRIHKQVVERYPEKRSNWIQLIVLYEQLKDERRALAALQLAHRAGVLEKRNDFVQLAQRLRSEDIPWAAAKVLEDAVKGGRIEMDKEIARVIALSLFAARDLDRAAPALARAGKLSNDGNLYMRLAQLEVERQRWDQAITAGKKALGKGLKEPGQAHLLIGISETRQGRTDAARRAFLIAKKSPSSRRAAEGWLTFLQAEAGS